ncbi:gamete antigen 27/25 [Plasmodium brasilianum]|uniref:Gamete antigen 27/25 n=1 Tax=Plasmodium brasilianum TaxID=5824 RepID=A0ACB9Y0C2_PLABR|nr:gamete antigen 27/25 [Plasmodium brasilianum]
MKIYTFLQIQFLILCAFIKCSGPWTKRIVTKKGNSTTVTYIYDPPYKYKYKNLQSDSLREEVKDLGNVEFHATLDTMYNFKYPYKGKKETHNMIDKNFYTTGSLDRFQSKYRYHFKDKLSREKCINRIKKRLNFIVIEGVLTDDAYCEEVKKVLWIEQRTDEEMSVKVDKLESEEEKDRMCLNKIVIKDLISKLEKAKALKLSEGMIECIVSTIQDFLLDLVRIPKEEVPSKNAREQSEGKVHKPNKAPSENSTTHEKN